ncbi:hypothetical protein CBS101457_000992 [Exobasidium rhododendri]|nr:hypothetical protein CBS101457_000992 [Exobasidium rhododendri]
MKVGGKRRELACTTARKGPSDRMDSKADTSENSELDGQQESRLKPKSLQRNDFHRPTRVAESRIRAASTDEVKFTLAKSTKRGSHKGAQLKTQLPPLRFSSDGGKSAWKFVLRTPKYNQSSDLPAWYDSSKDDLVVTLGACRPPLDPHTLNEQEEQSEDEHNSSSGSASSSTSSSSSCTSSSSSSQDYLTLSKSESRDDSSRELVNSMIKSFSIYAGPSFSAAAPKACHLPIPSFLTRS